MRIFFKIVLANLVALFLVGFLGVIFFGATFAALLQFEGETPHVEEGSVLVFNMSANLTDSPSGGDFWRTLEESMGTGSATGYSLRAVTHSIRSAATDPRVSALFIHGNFIPEGYGSGFSALREVRLALLEFRESGKPLIAYVEAPTVRDYYVASAAGRVIMNPYGMIGLSGLASQQIFIAGALEKYGVGIQVTRAGRYKSAVEMFTEIEMSEDNRTQIKELLDDLWGEILESVGESREISVADLQGMADGRGFIDPDLALEYLLVDEVGYLDQVLDGLREVTGTAADEHVPQVSMKAYSAAVEARPRRKRDTGGRVAIVYVEGDIVDGEGTLGSVGGDRFAREIRRMRQDDDIKALVVRINSPGGSVSASETIQREIERAREKMPVVVSFGSVAASGGYWIATASDRIFSQPNTITGSIGVFGILPNFRELANRHGVTFDGVRTARFADLFSLARPKTEAEMELIQEMVDEIYQDFLERVARGRDMSVERVHELAEGRVWSGKEALQHGLVDEMGGLGDAVGYAGEQAGLTNWGIDEFPRAADLAEMLAEMFSPETRPLGARDPVHTLVRELQGDYQTLQALNDPRGAYARMPFSLRIR